MDIYLIRHTSVDTPRGMCYGQTNVPLKDTFKEEADTVKSKIKDISFDCVFSSPLSRCQDLAHHCGFETPVLDERLKELFFGDWEGRMWDDIDMSIWKDDWVNPPTPNGESFDEMYLRVASFLADLKDKSYQSVAIFTHGGVFSCARVYFESIDLKLAFEIKTHYGDVAKFEG